MKRVAVADFGYWGKNLIRNFYELGVLSVVCDADPSKASVAAGVYPDVRFVTTFQGVLDDPEIDGVALATPAAAHAPSLKKLHCRSPLQFQLARS